MKWFYAIVDRIRRKSGYRIPRLSSFGFSIYNRFARGKFDSELFPGIYAEVDLSKTMMRNYYYNSLYYDPELAACLKEQCLGESVLFDVGANYGICSFWVATSCPQSTVYGFEPGPDIFKFLNQTQQRNHLDKVHFYNLGLSDENAELTFRTDPDFSGNSTFAADHPFHKEKQIQTFLVPVRTMDSFVEEQQIHKKNCQKWICKIDVEGFEYKVLRGMRQLLQNKMFDALIVEIFPGTLKCAGAEPKEIFDLMHSFGYKAYTLDGAVPVSAEHPAENVLFKLT